MTLKFSCISKPHSTTKKLLCLAKKSNSSWTFYLSGDENFYWNPNGDRKSIVLFSAQKFQWGWIWSAIFSIQFSMGIKHRIISQWGSLGYFFHRGRFFGPFFQLGGGQPGLWHRDVIVSNTYVLFFYVFVCDKNVCAKNVPNLTHFLIKIFMEKIFLSCFFAIF